MKTTIFAIACFVMYLWFVARLQLMYIIESNDNKYIADIHDSNVHNSDIYENYAKLDTNEYLTKLATYESSNRYYSQNGTHIGLYQLSKITYKDLVKHKQLTITFDSIKNSMQCQQYAQQLWMSRQYDLFVHYDLLKYLGMHIIYVHANGIDTTHYKLNIASMYAASHLVGCKNLKNWIVKEYCSPITKICDGNNVSIAEYAFQFRQLL